MQMTASLQGSILVTGASGGLGTALASHITTHYPAYYGIYTVRDASAPNHTLTSILTSSHEIVSLDLSRHASVRAAAADINARVARGQIPPIRVLILNAGLLEFEQQTWTEDGFDMSFAVNYLGHFLLTLLLLHSMDREQGRVVWIGSSTHDPYAPVVGRHYPNNRWKTIIPGQSTDAIAKGTWSTRAEDPTLHSGFRRYGAAKLCVAMMVGELQKRLNTDPVLGKITVAGVDPGTMSTGIVRHGSWFVKTVLHKIVIANVARMLALTGYHNVFLRTPATSARDVMDAGMNPKWHGDVYLHGSEIGQISAEAQDVSKRVLVWQDSVRFAELKEGDTMLLDWK